MRFLLIGLLAVTACESEEAKLQRLQGDRAVACLLAQKYEREVQQSNVNRPTVTYSDTLGRLWRDWDAKCTLATRELNRFMR